MEFETWWLVFIPVVFSLGWFAALFERRGQRIQHERLPNSYFKGVNFLLSEQPDKAIDAFLEVAEIDTDTVELHFALANLFRKKGEIDRAIRVHQFLSTSSRLKPNERHRAVYELGVDFLRAGILDRAESAFLSLASTHLADQGARQLLALYELEKDWSKAIAQAQALNAMGAEVSASVVAHFYCERAQAFLMELQAQSNLSEPSATSATPPILPLYAEQNLAQNSNVHSVSNAAQQLEQSQKIQAIEAELQQALRLYPGSVRASLMLGELEYWRHRDEQALHYWTMAEQQNPWYLPLVGQGIWNVFKRLNRPVEGLALLQRYCVRYPSVDLLWVLVQAIEEMQSREAAFNLLRQEVRARPSLLGLDKLLSTQQRDMLDPDRAQDIALTRELMAKHTHRLERYRCQHCGFQAKNFYWQCPGCAHWDTLVPRRVEELDFYPLPTFQDQQGHQSRAGSNLAGVL